MALFTRILRPSKTAYAHCDGPCGVYDPASARIAAEAVHSMEKKLAALGDGQDLASQNTRSRFIAIKEQQAELCKKELDILWHDYSRPEHLEKYPDLHTTFWNAAKLASKNKQTADAAAAADLLAATNRIAEIFWESKGVATRKAASNQAVGGELVYVDNR